MGAVVWYCPGTAEGPPKRLFLQKMYAVPCLTGQGEKCRSAGAAQPQLRCLCTTCPLAFRYSVFLPMEPLVLSYWGIWVLHNPMLEWLLAGHLAGWHHSCAGLTSPCFPGVILVGCGWCSLLLPSSQQGLAQPAAPFLDSYLSQFAVVKHVQRRVSQEWALFVFKMVLVLHSLSCLQPLFPLTLFRTAGLLQRARWHVSPYTSFSVVSLPDCVLAGSLCENASKPMSE